MKPWKSNRYPLNHTNCVIKRWQYLSFSSSSSASSSVNTFRFLDFDFEREIDFWGDGRGLRFFSRGDSEVALVSEAFGSDTESWFKFDGICVEVSCGEKGCDASVLKNTNSSY